MVRSAAIAPKLAPYPTLVGTSTTGQATSPPTTLARAPFHTSDNHGHIGLKEILPGSKINITAKRTIEVYGPLAYSFSAFLTAAMKASGSIGLLKMAAGFFTTRFRPAAALTKIMGTLPSILFLRSFL